MICSGREGLKEVGKTDGRWNWVLVGPDPEALPLAGGGPGSVDEMRSCFSKQEADAGSLSGMDHANLYGLIRLSFGTGKMGRTKWVFVHASQIDDQSGDAGRGPVSAVRHGQAMGQRPAMEKALSEFAHYTVKVEATSIKDLTLESFVSKVQKASTADAELLTLDRALEAYEEFRKLHPPPAREALPECKGVDMAEVINEVQTIFEEENAPLAEAMDVQAVAEAVDPNPEEAAPASPPAAATAAPIAPAATSAPPAAGEAPPPAAATPAAEAPAAVGSAEAAAMGLYKLGDLVFVYSNAVKQWMDDGVVVNLVESPCNHDGLDLPAGAIKVQYNNRRQYKWVTPAQMKHYLKHSQRPVPPPTLIGELLKETHNFITQWHVRYFELSKGHLQWWMSADDAKNGVKPNGSLSLLGLEMNLQDTVIYIKTTSSKGVIYAFDATTQASASKWVEMIHQHEEYCKKMQAYLIQQAVETRISDLEAAGAPRTG